MWDFFFFSCQRGQNTKEKTMNTVIAIIQIVIALGLLNVWLLRFNKSTDWRGGEAANMKEEFAAYGLPPWFMVLVGFLKISFAILLIVGLWVPAVTMPAAVGIAVLMLGAILMHIKVKDPLKRTLPAASLFILSLLVAIF
jgi:uncharacterized membrane protein YphA (DoxX/SURF4 family)